MFILVQTYQRESRRPAEMRSEHIGRVVGQVAPTILLASFSEAACFFLGKNIIGYFLLCLHLNDSLSHRKCVKEMECLFIFFFFY